MEEVTHASDLAKFEDSKKLYQVILMFIQGLPEETNL